MHIHELPWPKEILLGLEEIKTKMRVTLSYFIEPGPGSIGWKDKYRYPSCGLLFDVNKSGETQQEFIKRISKEMRDEEDNLDTTGGSDRWIIGVNNRNVGSVHSDIWEGMASDFCNANNIIVYLVAGWWKTRSYLKKYDREIRYSLIVTIETDEVKADLYTPIINAIKNKTVVKIEVVPKGR